MNTSGNANHAGGDGATAVDPLYTTSGVRDRCARNGCRSNSSRRECCCRTRTFDSSCSRSAEWAKRAVQTPRFGHRTLRAGTTGARCSRAIESGIDGSVAGETGAYGTPRSATCLVIRNEGWPTTSYEPQSKKRHGVRSSHLDATLRNLGRIALRRKLAQEITQAVPIGHGCARMTRTPPAASALKARSRQGS